MDQQLQIYQVKNNICSPDLSAGNSFPIARIKLALIYLELAFLVSSFALDEPYAAV